MMPTHIIRAEQGRRIMNRLTLRLVCMGYVAIALAAPLRAGAADAMWVTNGGSSRIGQPYAEVHCVVSNINIPPPPAPKKGGQEPAKNGTFDCTDAAGLKVTMSTSNDLIGNLSYEMMSKTRAIMFAGNLKVGDKCGIYVTPPKGNPQKVWELDCTRKKAV